jgi:hypothetical protein
MAGLVQTAVVAAWVKAYLKLTSSHAKEEFQALSTTVIESR